MSTKYTPYENLPGTGNWRNMDVHIGFKFSRADMLSGVDPYTRGIYLAYVARTFEKAYEWTDQHASLTAWNEGLYKHLNLPEVNVVLSGKAIHPILPSKFEETLAPWIDQQPEKTKRVPGELDILKHMNPQKAEIIIQGDALHAPKHIIANSGKDSLDSAIQEASKELMLRAVRLQKLQEITAQYNNVPADALEYWNREALKAHDIHGSQISMKETSKRYAELYTRIQQEVQPITPEQLKYGIAVELAGQYISEAFFQSDKQMYTEIMDEAIDRMEDANRDARYNTFTNENMMNEVLYQLPAETHEAFTAAYHTQAQAVLEQYPDMSSQWHSVTAAIRALQEIEDLVPQDIRYDVFHKLDLETRFIDAMEGREHEPITPFD